MRSTLLVFVATFLYAFQCIQADKQCNPCIKGKPLKNNQGQKVYCNWWNRPCPNGYKCRAQLCCPIFTPKPVTTTISTTVACPEFLGCPGGIIEYDKSGCPVCLIIDSCPGFPCIDLEYCFPVNNTFSNNVVIIGMCYSNPCKYGPPLEDIMKFSIPCDVTGNYTVCPSEYVCTPIKSNGAVCCPPATTSTSTKLSTTDTTCPEYPDCSSGETVYDENGCPLCLIVDTCPGFPCPEGYYCFASNHTLSNNVILGMCYNNPCYQGVPLNDDRGFSVVCDFTGNFQSCPNGYICTPTQLNSAVCCPSATTTSTPIPTTCPPLTDCTGIIVHDQGSCPICLYYDTCIQISCPENNYCLVEDATTNHWIANCVSQPCNYLKPHENELGVTTLCSTNASNCPDNFVCSIIPNDSENRHVCCPSSTTTSLSPESTTTK